MVRRRGGGNIPRRVGNRTVADRTCGLVRILDTADALGWALTRLSSGDW